MDDFAPRVLDWFRHHGRHDLPWQGGDDGDRPYRVWVSEIMLQQTGVSTVIGYFERFVARFPDVDTLARADLDEVLALWSGLGYYARARNLHRTAGILRAEHGSHLPADLESLTALPGVGRSTAGAILSTSLDVRAAVLDGNVKRVLARHAGVEGWPGRPVVARRLWELAEVRTPAEDYADYTQAMMDLGATVCTARSPECGQCPVATDCVARIEDRIGELPGRKPAAGTRRCRTALFPLVVSQTPEGPAVLLERRPDKGIWGGLYCPPELDEGTDPAVWAEGLGLQVIEHHDLPVVEHSFTHYDLRMLPVVLRVTGANTDSPGWYTLDEATDLGLPAPVRTLVERLGHGGWPG